MARQFPRILDLESAFRFVLEAELAGADFAAAAELIAPDAAWREKLDELTCGHDDRLQKLRSRDPDPGRASAAAWPGIDGEPFAQVLDAEPATSLPAAAEQMATVEDAVAGCHEAFVAAAGDALGDDARVFAKAAAQARAAAADLRGMLA